MNKHNMFGHSEGEAIAVLVLLSFINALSWVQVVWLTSVPVQPHRGVLTRS